MKDYLTISQVAKLLNISIHKIRYYEKEGLIDLPYKTEKGYRYYSFSDVEALCGVIMLRKSDMSINMIKNLFDDYKPEKFQECLKASKKNVEMEIERLNKVKQNIERMMMKYQTMPCGFYQTIKEARTILPIKKCRYDEEMTEKEFYDFYVESDLDENYLYASEFLSILDSKMITYGLLVEKMDLGLAIPSGNYLCYRFNATTTFAFEEALDEFKQYIKQNNIKTSGKLFLEEKSEDVFHQEVLKQSIYEYQVKILSSNNEIKEY